MIRDSFPAKLLVLLLGVAILIGGIGGVIWLQTGDALETSVQDNMEHSTQLQANTLGEWVERNHNQAGVIAGSSAAQSGESDRIEALLNEESDRFANSVGGAHYVDANTGEVLESSEAGAVGASYAETKLATLEAPPPGESVVTPTYTDPTIDDQPAVAFVAAVDEDHLIVMPVDLQQRVERLERPSEIDGSFTHVVNSEGMIVLSHMDPINEPNMGEEGDVQSMAVMQGLDGETGYMQMEMMGHDGEMAMGFAPIEGTDWVIMTHIPADQAFALQEDTQWAVLALVLVSVLGLGIVGAVVGRNTTKALRRLTTAAEEIESGNLDIDLESSRTDEFGQLYGSFDGMRQTLKTNIQEIQEARETAEHEQQRVKRLNEELETAAESYSSVMTAAADGDLTVRADTEVDHEAMETIGEEFNAMLDEIETTVAELRQFAREVATASEEVTASSEEVRSASESVSESIQTISDGATRQHDSLTAVNGEMENLSTTTEEIAASSNQVADTAERTAETGREGREAAQRALAGINTIESNAEGAAGEIESLEREVAQIDDLIETIQQIAEQTNMLALNANIEASRSGNRTEDGEGFGVVAQEVKELSEDAKEAAEAVESRLESIRQQTDRSAQEVQATREEIEAHATAIENAAGALEEIAGYAEETNTGVQEISAATEEQAATTEEVVAMVSDATEVSKETTTEAERVAAAAEEQTTAMTEISQSAAGLSQQAAQLSEALDRFDTDADVAVSFDEIDTTGVAESTDALKELEGSSALDDLDTAIPADDAETSIPPADDPGGPAENQSEGDTPELDGFADQQPPAADDADSSIDEMTETVSNLVEETDELELDNETASSGVDTGADEPADGEAGTTQDDGTDQSDPEDVFEFGAGSDE